MWISINLKVTSYTDWNGNAVYDFYVNHGFLDSCVIMPDNNIIMPAVILERIFGITSSEDILRLVDMIETKDKIK